MKAEIRYVAEFYIKDYWAENLAESNSAFQVIRIDFFPAQYVLKTAELLRTGFFK